MELGEYNSFCKNLKRGNILYNIDPTNLWGEYLLVANITPVRIGNIKTYTVLLIGLRKKEGEYVPCKLCVSLTPDNYGNIPFLKIVGYCKFDLLPVLENVKVNVGLVAIFGNVDLQRFTNSLNIRKPRKKRYDRNGNLVINKTLNYETED